MLKWILLTLSLLIAPYSAAAPDIGSASFSEKSELLKAWLQQEPEQAQRAIDLMLNGQLYYQRKTGELVIVEQHKSGSPATRFEDGSNLVLDKKRNYKRVSLNNALRLELRQLNAQQQLAHPDSNVRLSAIQTLLTSLSAQDRAVLQARLQAESDPDVIEWIELGLASLDLSTSDAPQAIQTLSEGLSVEAMDALRQVPEDSPYFTQARDAISKIEQARARYDTVETLYFGLSLGSVLVLAGIGLAITFGVMGVINMAHGELIMLGAYTTFVIQQILPGQPGLALLLSIPAAFVVSGSVGIAIQRGVIRFLHGRPLETLLATFGISLILQQAVRTIFSPLNQTVVTPDWLAGSWQINAALSLTLNRLFVIGFCLVVFFALLALLKRSALGLQVRAVSQNRSMAQAMGVRSERVDAMTFGLGSGVAGLAGVALSLLTNVGPNMGQAYIIDSFMVVVFGGVGSLWGTLVSGISLGVANKLIEPWAGAVLAKILVLVFLVLFIQKNPRGLFPQRGRAAES